MRPQLYRSNKTRLSLCQYILDTALYKYTLLVYISTDYVIIFVMQYHVHHVRKLHKITSTYTKCVRV